MDLLPTTTVPVVAAVVAAVITAEVLAEVVQTPPQVAEVAAVHPM
jgi:hypothetical protein